MYVETQIFNGFKYIRRDDIYPFILFYVKLYCMF